MDGNKVFDAYYGLSPADHLRYLADNDYMGASGGWYDDGIALKQTADYIEKLEQTLKLCASFAGNPDATVGCRNVIAEVKEGLKLV